MRSAKVAVFRGALRFAGAGSVVAGVAALAIVLLPGLGGRFSFPEWAFVLGFALPVGAAFCAWFGFTVRAGGLRE